MLAATLLGKEKDGKEKEGKLKLMLETDGKENEGAVGKAFGESVTKRTVTAAPAPLLGEPIKKAVKA